MIKRKSLLIPLILLLTSYADKFNSKDEYLKLVYEEEGVKVYYSKNLDIKQHPRHLENWDVINYFYWEKDYNSINAPGVKSQ